MPDKKPSRLTRSAEPTLGRRPAGRNSEAQNKSASTSSAKPSRGKPQPSQRGDRAHKKPGSDNGRPRGNKSGSRKTGKPAARASAGVTARYLALTIIESVIRDQTSLDAAIPTALEDQRFSHLEPRDRAFARLLAMTVLRNHANLQTVVASFLQKPLNQNAERIRLILLIGAAELILLKVAPHATISTAVEMTRLSKRTEHFDRLANAVLRRVSETGADLFTKTASPAANVPDWMISGWQQAYGTEAADRIAAASLTEAALDLTTKQQPIDWASRLDAIVLPTGTLRRAGGGRIEDLEGYTSGDWWVQDAAAALPARLLNPSPGARILDLCAAPGGKTAQLAAAGADVTAVDVSETRMQRLRTNLSRLGMTATVIAGDATTWRDPTPFDAVLIDAPCTATGTIRRHPDILHLKRSNDTSRLAEVQNRLLRNAAGLVKVGGTIVYCTCSLEPIECEQRVAGFLVDPGGPRRKFERQPIKPSEIGNQTEWITPEGDLRTFPYHLPNENQQLAGIDGFYAARLIRTA